MVGVFDEMLVYSYRMKYEEKRDYEKWQQTIYEFVKKSKIDLDGKFDWDEIIYEDGVGRIVLKPKKGGIKRGRDRRLNRSSRQNSKEG